MFPDRKSKYAKRGFPFTNTERPIRHAEKMTGLLHASIYAKHHGAHFPALGVDLVLDKRIAIVEAPGFVVVVVEPLVLQSHLVGDGAAELPDLPRGDVGIEGD